MGKLHNLSHRTTPHHLPSPTPNPPQFASPFDRIENLLANERDPPATLACFTTALS